MCFEVVDAKYRLVQPVTVEISATKSGTTIEDGELRAELGDFSILNLEGQWVYYPFMRPIFRQSEVSSLGSFVDKNHRDPSYSPPIVFFAHDLWFEEGIPGVNTYMPCTLGVNWVERGDNTVHWRIIAIHPCTGFLLYLEHLDVSEGTAIPMLAGTSPEGINHSEGWALPYDPDTPLAQIGPSDKGMRPHLHIECQNPYKPLVTDGIS